MIQYPDARRSDFIETLHGVDVPDPYRWLEDLDSAETRAWIEAQCRLSENFLAQIPSRADIHRRLQRVWNYPRLSVPVERGGRYFFTHNDGLQDQDVLYWTDSPQRPPQVLCDPNQLSDEGTVALVGFNPSDDGRYLAYGLSQAGSDWQEWRVRCVDTGQDLDDLIQWAKTGSVGWDRSGRGFYYSRFDKPPEGEELKSANYYQKIYYHRLNTHQTADELIYHRPDHKDWYLSAYVTEDGHYLVIRVAKGTLRENGLFYQYRQDRENAPPATVELFNAFDAAYSFIGNDEQTFYIHTTHNAPKGRVVAVDLNRPDPGCWRTLVPERDDVLSQATLLNGSMLILHYLVDAHSKVEVYGLSGRHLRSVELPGIGTVSGFNGRRSSRETFYQYSSFAQPGAIYRYELESGENHLYHQPQLDVESGDIVTEQHFFKSKDGTRVPMFLSFTKSTDRSRPRPTFLYGYGGFNIPLTPSFSVRNLIWMEMGGVFAQVNLRGGGEYGQAWYKAGTRAQKQNVFDDLIAAAEYLIEHGITSREQLAIGGGSNGGLLVGAAMTQRPDLFGACWAAVGVLDMLRFHKFTVGWGWVSDYGSPEDADDFRTLLAYSPYHNVSPGTEYPATLITTGDHDDRVFPAHSFKFAAALQHAQAGEKPTLIRIATDAGHGAGKPTTKLIAEATDVLAFLQHVLQMEPLTP